MSETYEDPNEVVPRPERAPRPAAVPIETEAPAPAPRTPRAPRDPNASIFSDVLTTPDNNTGAFGNLTNALSAGALNAAGSVAAAGEYLAGSGGVFSATRDWFERNANALIQGTSREFQENLRREFLPGGDGPSAYESVGSLFGSLYAQALISLPSAVVSFVPAGMAARMVVAAGGSYAAAAGAAAGVAGASNSAMVGGATWQGISEAWRTAPAEEVQASEVYRRFYDAAQGTPEERDRDARELAARETLPYAPAIAGAVGAATGALLQGAVASRVATGQLGFLQSIRQTALSEARQEFVEGSAQEGLIQASLAPEQALNRPMDYGEIARQGVQGAVVGGAVGGAMGAIGYRPPPRLPDPGIDPSAPFNDPAPQEGQLRLEGPGPGPDFTVDSQGSASPGGTPPGPAPNVDPSVAAAAKGEAVQPKINPASRRQVNAAERASAVPVIDPSVAAAAAPDATAEPEAASAPLSTPTPTPTPPPPAGQGTAAVPPAMPPAGGAAPAVPSAQTPSADVPQGTVAPTQAPAPSISSRVAARTVEDLGIDPADIAGTGKDGAITANDVASYLAQVRAFLKKTGRLTAEDVAQFKRGEAPAEKVQAPKTPTPTPVASPAAPPTEADTAAIMAQYNADGTPKAEPKSPVVTQAKAKLADKSTPQSRAKKAKADAKKAEAESANAPAPLPAPTVAPVAVTKEVTRKIADARKQARDNIIRDVREALMEPPTASELNSLVDSIMNDVVNNVQDAPDKSLNKLVAEMGAAAQERIAQAVKPFNDAYDSRFSANDTQEKAAPEYKPTQRISENLLTRALDGKPGALLRVVQKLLSTSRKELGRRFRDQIAPALEMVRDKPEWATALARYVEASSGRGGATKGEAGKARTEKLNQQYNAWVEQFSNAAGTVEEQAAAMRDEIVDVFRESKINAEATPKQYFERLNALRDEIRDITGESSLEAVLERIDSTDSEAAAVVTFIWRAARSTLPPTAAQARERQQDFAVVEFGLRGAQAKNSPEARAQDAWAAIASMKETANIAATQGRGGPGDTQAEPDAIDEATSLDDIGRDEAAVGTSRAKTRLPQEESSGAASGRVMKTAEQFEAMLRQINPAVTPAQLQDGVSKLLARQAAAEKAAADSQAESTKSRREGNPESNPADTRALLAGEPVATVYGDMDFVTSLAFPDGFGTDGTTAGNAATPRVMVGSEVQRSNNGLLKDLWARLRSMTRDVPIFVYSDAAWEKAFGANNGILGQFIPNSPAGIEIGGAAGIIVMPESTFRNPAAMRETLMHELVHAAARTSITGNTQERAQLQALMQRVRNAYADPANPGDTTKPQMPAEVRYALSNVHEFLAMAMTNERVQQELLAIPLPISERIRMKLPAALSNLWGNFTAWMRDMLGFQPGQMDNVLSAVASVAERSMQTRSQQESLLREPGFVLYDDDPEVLNRMGDAINNAFRPFVSPGDGEPTMGDRAKGIGTMFKRFGLGFSTMRQIELAYSNLFERTARLGLTDPNGRFNPLQLVSHWHLRRGKIAEDKFATFMSSMRLMRNLTADQRKRVSDLLIDSSLAEAHPDEVSPDGGRNAHLKGPRARQIQGRARHAALRKTYLGMSAAEQAAYREVVAATEKQHAELTNALMDNVVQRWWTGMVDRFQTNAGRNPLPMQPGQLAALRDRLLKGPPPTDSNGNVSQNAGTGYMTEADQLMLGEATAAMAKTVRDRAKMQGPYVPLQRHGNFIVAWTEDFPPERIFKSQAEQRAEIEKTPHTVRGTETRYYDANNRPILTPDDADQTLRAAERGKELSLLPATATPFEKMIAERKADKTALKAAQKAAARTEYVVLYQNKGMAAFDTEAEAIAAQRQLIAEGKKNVKEPDIRNRALQSASVLSDVELARVQTAIGRDENLTPAMRESALEAFQTAVLLITPQRLVNSSLVQRRKVAGASRDVQRTLANYGVATSNFIASVQTSIPISEGLRAMREERDRLSYQGEAGGQETMQRASVLNELEARVLDAPINQAGGGSQIPILRDLQAMAYVFYLASPSYSMIQMTQPWLLTLPILNARYGAGKAGRALSRAMGDMGIGGVLKAGGKDVYGAMKTLATGKEGDPSDLLGFVKANLGKQRDGKALTELVDSLVEEGLIDSNAGMELVRAEMGESNKFRTKLGQLESLARAFPASIEMTNRVGSAVAAYRLAVGAGVSHAEAIAYARKVVDQSQADYSTANTARYMDTRRYPWLAPMMTFRKYAQAIYSLLIRQAIIAVKGKTKEERVEAFRLLAGVLAAHTVVAGALGLPTEPISIALGIAALLMGADEPWDWEKEIRQAANEVLGEQAAEILMRGLPRAAGIDLSSRLGLNSLIFMRDVRDYEKRSLNEYLGEFLLGAPGAMVMSALSVPKALGDAQPGAAGTLRAVEPAMPKGIRDIFRAVRFENEGITTTKGERLDGGRDRSGFETVMTALGIGSSRDAEAYERRDAVQGANRRYTQERTRLMREWRQADPGEGREAAWQRIQRFNATIPPEGREFRVTRANLQASLREATRRERESGGRDYLPRNRRWLEAEGEFAND